jgi:enoyl-CoA hydratase/carnithine racemase
MPQKSTFDCSISAGIACVHATRGAFLLGTDLETKQRLKNLLRDLEINNEVNAVLLINTADAFTATEHRNYVESLEELRKDHDSDSAAIMFEQEDNALKQFDLLALGYKKLLVSCLVGEIASPFFGLSLATDIRIAEEGMHFSLSHVALDLPPTGGLGFLLLKYVSQGRAAELLLLGGTIGAQASYQMGLVNKVFPPARFEADCIDWVHSMLRLGTKHIPYTRKFLYNDCPTFDAYLQKESNIRLKAFNRKHIV